MVSSKRSKILFPMIAYGGLCRGEYSLACSSLFIKTVLQRGDVSFSSTGIFFESLVSRARNSAAASMLNGDYTHLLFIDVDIDFAVDDVFKLIDADLDVVTGLYPKKYLNQEKISYLANNKPSVFQDKNWSKLATDFSTEVTEKTLNQVRQNSKFVEVNYAATGFMLIKRHVFLEIIKQKPHIKYRNDIDGYSGYGDNFYDFFPAKINQETKKFESEDYGFCNLWKECGGKIHAIPEIELGHLGNYKYQSSFKHQLDFFE